MSFLQDENWLFSYEIAIKKWIGRDFKYIDENPFFRQLRKAKISFYDGNRQIDFIDFSKEEVLELDQETEYEKEVTIADVELVIAQDVLYDFNEGDEDIDFYPELLRRVDDNLDFDELDFDYLNSY